MHRRTAQALVLLSCGTLFADYIEDRVAAVKLMRGRKYEEALAAFTQMAKGEISDFQRADALEQAAECARRLKKYDLAAELASQIPLAPVAKTVEMQNLAAQRKFKQLVEKFRSEDIDKWPEWKAWEAFYARGRAFYEIGDGKAAEVDLTKAGELTMDDLARARVWITLGKNRAKNLKDEEGALTAYRLVVEKCRSRGSHLYFEGVLAAAGLLRKQAKYDEAVETLRKMKPHDRVGYWHGVGLCALARILADAGRHEEALAAYKEVLADEKVHRNHRKAAQEAIDGAEK